MSLSYDTFTGAFLHKITEYDFANMLSATRESVVDGYMKTAISKFKKVCKYDLSTTADDTNRQFGVTVETGDLDEIVDIVTAGMVVCWLRPYVNSAELLRPVLNTRDYTQYSSAELLTRVGNAYKDAVKEFKQLRNEYSYDHNDLTELHT